MRIEQICMPHLSDLGAVRRTEIQKYKVGSSGPIQFCLFWAPTFQCQPLILLNARRARYDQSCAKYTRHLINQALARFRGKIGRKFCRGPGLTTAAFTRRDLARPSQRAVPRRARSPIAGRGLPSQGDRSQRRADQASADDVPDADCGDIHARRRDRRWRRGAGRPGAAIDPRLDHHRGGLRRVDLQTSA